MASATRKLRSLDTTHAHLNEQPPPLSSPTKRSNPGQVTGESDCSPRVLRTKLSNVQDEITLEVRLKNVEGVPSGSETAAHDPSTPPEVPLEVMPSLEELQAKDQGATQTEAAERQNKELAAMPLDQHYLLARLCSQHPSSEYNNLKRAVAASPLPQPVQHIHSHPMPPLRHTQSAGPGQTPNRPIAPARTASAGLLVSPKPSNSSPLRPPSTTNGSTVPPRSTLTPSLARVNFEFSLSSQPTTSPSPIQVERRSAAEHTVDTILTDLVEGEPVTLVERTPTKVVVAETVPSLDQPVQSSDRNLPTPPTIPGLLPGMQMINGVPVKTSVSHPINISPLVPTELLPYFAARILSPPASEATSSSDDSTTSPTEGSSFVVNPQPSCDLLTLTTIGSDGYFPTPPNFYDPSPSSSGKIGNFMLSSCPGKKVRMNGESLRGGRGAICRDVKLDLQRAKDEGVGMVVCCLDDSELAYLGTPFSEYSAACDSLSLQILRIPMVEGFAPSSPSSLDAQLDRLIKEHTLRGQSVLAHCRGGIGRAGLVASCWMIKMGMVNRRSGFEESSTDGPGEIDWMEEKPIVIVERVIELIRRRRSVKSIETTHQVKFLLEYVAYLQANARIVHGSQIHI